MGYTQYLENEWNPIVQISQVETRAAGFTVGRMYVPELQAVNGAELADVILESSADLTFLRYPSALSKVAGEMLHPDLVILPADTLLYFESKVTSREVERIGIDLVDESNSRIFRETLADIFRDYTNHYSANPLLAHIDVSQAYIEWARSCIDDANHMAALATNSEGKAFGAAVVDTQNSDFDEILLAGIVQHSRRQGHYLSLLKSLMNITVTANKQRMIISTQASNIPVMRSWSKLEFKPLLSLNTVHIIKKSHFAAVIG